MKIRLLSDLHLEGNRFYYEYQGEDIVVLAGDIHTQGRHNWLLDQIPSNVKVLMVAGNHEYYGAVLDHVNDHLYYLQAEYPNFWFLNNEHVIIDGIDFYGGTMFTDLMLYGDAESAAMYAKKGIADFSWISKYNPPPADFDNSYQHRFEKLWTPDDHVFAHVDFCRGLDKFIADTQPGRRVVISHFVPHPDASDQRFTGSPLNPYFISNMSRYFDDIKLWMFGHTHSSCDLVKQGCRLVCNPHGYGSENSSGFRNDLILEI